MSKTAMKNEKDEKTYPEGGYGWLTVIGCFIVTFFVRGTVASLGVLFIAFVEHYGKGSGATSWVPSMYGSLGLALAPVAAASAKRFGHRRVVMTGGILAFTSLMLGSFASNIWQLALTVGTLHGFAAGLSFSPTTSYIGHYFNRRHSIANGIGYTGIGVGSMVLPLIFQSCLDKYGLQGTLWIYAAMSANICISAAILRPVNTNSKSLTYQTPELPNTSLSIDSNCDEHSSHLGLKKNKSNEDNQTAHSRSNKPNQGLGERIRRLFTRLNEFFDCSRLISIRLYDIFLVSFFTTGLGLTISAAHLAPLINEAGISKTNTAILMSMYGIGNVLSGPFWGSVATFSKINIYVFVGCAYIGYGLAVLFTPFLHTFSSAAVFVVSLGFGRGAFAAQNSVCIRRMVGDSLFVTGYGWALTMSGAGQLTGPLMSGYLADYTGTYNYSFYLAGLITIGGGVFFLIGYVVDRRLKKRWRPVDSTCETDIAETVTAL
ncbi:monocarboxylate transporter 12-like [Ptychodera flava]|uniref:monocarboxylate transporter 12-like n=1 Tax=Ptychodera flava TaxID=63121 RepID=UPI00396A89C3